MDPVDKTDVEIRKSSPLAPSGVVAGVAMTVWVGVTKVDEEGSEDVEGGRVMPDVEGDDVPG